MKIETTIRIEVQDQVLELTKEEAKELQEALNTELPLPVIPSIPWQQPIKMEGPPFEWEMPKPPYTGSGKAPLIMFTTSVSEELSPKGVGRPMSEE